jgi:hypothetical protein
MVFDLARNAIRSGAEAGASVSEFLAEAPARLSNLV